MRFKYVGEPKADGSRELNRSQSVTLTSANGVKSYRFRAGEAVEVDDEMLCKRLSGSNHFEAVAAEIPAAAVAGTDPDSVSKAKKGGKAKADDASGA